MNGMSMTVAKHSILKTWREKWGLISWLVIPLMMVFLMSLMAGGGPSPTPHGKVLVTDKDQSMLSQFLLGSIGQGPTAEFFTVKVVKEAEAQTLMDAGEASAWLMIEKNFMDDYLNKKPTTITLRKNPAQTILPNMVETGMDVMVDAADYLQMLFADELQKINKMVSTGKYNDADLVVLTLAIKAAIEDVEDTLMPPQIKLEEKTVEAESDDKPAFNFALMMFPGAVFMSLLFAGMGMAMSFWDDKVNGVLPRLVSTPSGIFHYFVGKTTHAKVMFLTVSVVLMVVGVAYFDVNVTLLPLLIFWLVFSGVVIWQLLLFFSLLMPSRKSANIIVNAAMMPLAMLGGSFFPAEAMSDGLAKIGSYLPNGMLLKAIKDVMIRGEAWQSALLWPFVIGLVMALVFWFINLKMVKKLAQEARS